MYSGRSLDIVAVCRVSELDWPQETPWCALPMTLWNESDYVGLRLFGLSQRVEASYEAPHKSRRLDERKQWMVVVLGEK